MHNIGIGEPSGTFEFAAHTKTIVASCFALLQEKLEITGGVNRNDVQLNGRDILNGDQEMLEEVDDNN